MLVVILGVDEGYAQEIPWESLPLIRAFIKERLALVAFLNCICSSRVVGPSWNSVSGSATSEFIVRHFLLEGNTLNFGCIFSSWKEGLIGTLSCHSRKYCDILQQEIITLISAFNNLPSSFSII